MRLSKWTAGVETVLASTSPVLIPNATTMAISDTGGVVTAWQKPAGGTAFTSLLSVNDSTYSSGLRRHRGRRLQPQLQLQGGDR